MRSRACPQGAQQVPPRSFQRVLPQLLLPSHHKRPQLAVSTGEGGPQATSSASGTKSPPRAGAFLESLTLSPKVLASFLAPAVVFLPGPSSLSPHHRAVCPLGHRDTSLGRWCCPGPASAAGREDGGAESRRTGPGQGAAPREQPVLLAETLGTRGGRVARVRPARGGRRGQPPLGRHWAPSMCAGPCGGWALRSARLHTASRGLSFSGWSFHRVSVLQPC